MTHYLSIEPSKWAETIEAHGIECLTSKTTAKNVRHVLSTATVRAPQKTLCNAVVPLIGEMLTEKDTVSVLTALVEFGTSVTVEKIAEGLVSADPKVWSLKSAPADNVAEETSRLLERLVYRADATGENCQKIVDALRGAARTEIVTSPFLLPAAARLAVVDSKFAGELCKDNKAKKRLGEACTTAALRSSVEQFVRVALESREAVDQISTFVLEAVQHLLAASSTQRPSEALLLTLASKGTAATAEKMVTAVSSWSNLHEMAEKDGFAKILAVLLERAAECKAGVKIVQSVFTSADDVDNRIKARKTAQLHLLSAVQSRRTYTEAMNKSTSVDQSKKLRSAKVLYTSATVPKAAATQDAIMAKLQARGVATTTTGSARKATKRSREQ